MKDHGWAAAAIMGCVSAVLAFVPASAGAQETTLRWYRMGGVQPLEYASEREAQLAVEATAVAYGIVVQPVNWGVRAHSMTRDNLVTVYGVMPTPIKKAAWEYSYAGVTYPSEEAVLSVMRSGNAALCAVTAPAPEWVYKKGVGKDPANSTLEQWTKGVTISWRNTLGRCLAPVASSVDRSRSVKCPDPTNMKWKDELAGCVLSDYLEATYRPLMSYYTKQTPKLCHGVGNPCDPTTGEKVQRESELALPWIQMERHYHSKSRTAGGGFGPNWTHTHNVRMAILPSAGAPSVAGLIDEDGSHVAFEQKSGSYLAIDGSGDRAEYVYNVGWIVKRRSEVLRFSRTGLIQQREYEDGTTLIYSHDGAGRLKEICHSTGRKVEFSYADAVDEKIAALTINGAPYASYSYGENGQLASVAYADGRSRLYHYEDSRFPWHLTGVTAEDGRRFSWFGYDEKGRVTCSRHDAGCN
ncbi:DUF6531 domain-containing protein [Stenotrophomonas lactitubi]|uniref:DUF6531 domain-containing protein n=1 Tax=Stenotrophomonas lactitubi TaxID=2045214 RepID=UPI00203CF195|nr:DUF6531 domain-containing protein [Stenotrophomonas lactitubi]